MQPRLNVVFYLKPLAMLPGRCQPISLSGVAAFNTEQRQKSAEIAVGWKFS